MREVVIVDGVRTATGKFEGSLSKIPAPMLGAECVKAIIERNKLDPTKINELIIGTLFQAGIKGNAARQCGIHAGLPDSIPAFTPNKQCATALKSMHLAAQGIQVGDSDVIIAGGCENMSDIPYLLKKARFGYRMGPGEIHDSMMYDGLVDAFMNYHMGITAENVAEQFGVSREVMDEFAVESHQKAAKAWAEGKFDGDIAPITIKNKKGDIVFDKDETVNPDATYEAFAKMKPVFKPDGGKVTVGNASPVNDGAAVVLMMSADKANELGYKPIAKYVGSTTTALHPSIMGYAPVSAVEQLEAKTGIKREQIGLFEMNEAFAAQAYACIRDLKLDPAKVNVNGGAIALGHPVGATGARLALTVMREMQRRNEQYGVATMCIGGGMAMAMLFELC